MIPATHHCSHRAAATAVAIRCIATSLLFAMARAAPKPLPAGIITLNSNPAEATVTIDRHPVGTTPLTTRLAAGEHLLKVECAGFHSEYRTINIVAEESYTFTFELSPLTGLLLVHSTPDEAEISINGLDFGRTPALISTLPLGSHRVRLEQPGFRSKELEVTLSDRAPRHLNIDLTSSSATLHITSNIPGSEVLLNGVPRGSTPCTIDRIPAGDTTLEVRAAGYVAYSQAMRLAEGEVQNIQARLEEEPATLQIVSLPGEARVYLNNEYRGETPLTLTPLAAGEHRVRVERDGFEPNARTINLERGTSRTEEFRLAGNTGRLLITTEPDGATILVAGKEYGRTLAAAGEGLRASAPFAVELLPEGLHAVRVVRQGYYEKTVPVEISRGQTASIHVALERRFIPNYEITTASGVYRGVLIERGDDAIRLEVAPGVISTYLLKDVKQHQLLPDALP